MNFLISVAFRGCYVIAHYKAFWDLYQEGKEVADPKTWKNRQRLINALVLLFSSCVTIAGGMGFEIHVTPTQLLEVAGGLATVYAIGNEVLIVITSKKVGTKPR